MHALVIVERFGPPFRPVGDAAMARRSGNHVAAEDDTVKVLASDIAKWLVPSVTVLFGVVGFVAQSAQDGLLGLGASTDSSRYISSAADFVVAVIAAIVGVVTALFAFTQVSIAGFFWGLIGATLATACVLLLPSVAHGLRLDRSAFYHRYHAYLVPALAVVLLLFKFLVFDAPLLKVENVILGSWSHGTDSPDLGQTFAERLQHGTESLVSARTERLWSEIVCSRIGDSIGPTKVNVPNVTCLPGGLAANQHALNGEFLAQLWLMSLIAILALAILRSAAAQHFMLALAVLSLLYALTLPYAFGKLMKSTYYEYGRVRLAPTMAVPADQLRPQPNSTPAQSGGAATSATGAGAQQQMTQALAVPLRALILSRGSASTDLLVAKRRSCGTQPGTSERVSQSSLSPSQVLSIEEIYRQDVITWATLHQHACQAGNPAHGRKQ